MIKFLLETPSFIVGNNPLPPRFCFAKRGEDGTLGTRYAGRFNNKEQK
jgi:hypothetical protein